MQCAERSLHDACAKERIAGLRVAEIRDCDSLSLVRPMDTPPDTAALVLASGATVLHRVF